jgi:threonine dehydrogenase-like Zn-dependent dehydrogenase
MMRAARFVGNERIEIVEKPVPTPVAGDVQLRVHSCALCGTDRHAYRAGSTVTPGHEIAGVVTATGPEADPSLLARPGVVYLVDYCGRCPACTGGRMNMCSDKRRMFGLDADGGFADYVTVRSECFLPVDGNFGLDAATMLLDLLGTSGHAFRRAGVTPRHVAVMGCGPIGMGAIAVARALGAEEIVAVEVSDYRLELARRLGAVPIDARGADAVVAARQLRPEGFDVVIEAAGLTETQDQAVRVAGAGGSVVFVAHNPEPLEVHVSRDLIQHERSVLGSEYFPLKEFPYAVSLLEAGHVDPDVMITHRVPLEDIQTAFEEFTHGRTGKVLVQP